MICHSDTSSGTSSHGQRSCGMPSKLTETLGRYSQPNNMVAEFGTVSCLQPQDHCILCLYEVVAGNVVPQSIMN